MFDRNRLERELDTELRGYVRLLTEEKIRAGLSPEDARRAALAEVGSLEAVKDAVRDVRRGAWVETLRQDLRYGIRSLARSPWFTTMGLAVGIAGATAMFTVVRGVLLRQLDVRDAASVMAISESNGDRGLRRPSASATSALAWARDSRTLESLAAYLPHNVDITGSGEPQEVLAHDLSRDFVGLTGARLVIGRGFTPDDHRESAPPVVLLDERYWRAAFGADSSVLGRSLTVNGDGRVIVGVLRTGWPRAGELYLPMRDTFLGSASWSRRTLLVARLRAGVAPATAREELRAIATRVHADDPVPTVDWAVDLDPLLDIVVGNVRRTLYVLLGAVGFLLAIVCANVAGLLFARAGARSLEIEIRLALGASRRRVMRQLLVEGLLLTSLGSGLGLLLAWWGVALLRWHGPASLPRLDEIGVDARVLALSVAVTVTASLLVALAPAWQASRWHTQTMLRTSGRTVGSGRTSRTALVVAELAFATVLVVGAGLVARSLANQMDIPLGFDPRNMLALDIDLPGDRYDGARLASFVRDVEARVRVVPGVAAVGTAAAIPFESFGPTRTFRIEGRTATAAGPEPAAFYTPATPGYLRAMQPTLLRGRYLDENDDRAGAPRAVVINETMARRYWDDADPVGQRLRLSDDIAATVVGVVTDIRQRELREPVTPAMWVSWSQAAQPSMLIVVRADGVDPASLFHDAARAVWAVDPLVPVEPRVMRDMYAGTMETARFDTALLVGFAAIALLVAAMGIFGLVAWSVALRRREIGVRMALGATAADVQRMVAKEGLRLALLGLAAGLTGALALTRVMAAVLYGVSARDGVSLTAAVTVLGSAAFLASWIPARRAAAIPPAEALRQAP
jgi:predicted permease